MIRFSVSGSKRKTTKEKKEKRKRKKKRKTARVPGRYYVEYLGLNRIGSLDM